MAEFENADLTVEGCIYLAGVACYHKQMRDDTILWTKLSEQEQCDWIEAHETDIENHLEELIRLYAKEAKK